MENKNKKLIFDALQVAKEKDTDIYTFALYHDHESGFVTVCIDTIESSILSVINQNKFTAKYFLRAIESKDISSAQRWLANSGRSLALGDFKLKNVVELKLSSEKVDTDFYIEMVLAINEMSELIQMQSTHGKHLIFCCSTESDEVGLVWANT